MLRDHDLCANCKRPFPLHLLDAKPHNFTFREMQADFGQRHALHHAADHGSNAASATDPNMSLYQAEKQTAGTAVRWNLVAVHEDGSRISLGHYPTRRQALVVARILKGRS